jgi:predicted nucleotidyltransferase
MSEDVLSQRAAACIKRISGLKITLLANIDETLAAQLAQDRSKAAELRAALGGTSIYATGSVGRLEASEYSDLDVFVISGALDQDPLGKLQGYELIADLIRTARQNEFPRFSRDGLFLTTHALTDILGEVGKPEDDYHNRFTARMLLLLESHCLYGSQAYDHTVARVLERYWPASEPSKLPIFLINDLVRY